ncbi:MAG: hypothetical protein ACE5O2_16855 [Armatimonadota bacterium]
MTPKRKPDPVRLSEALSAVRREVELAAAGAGRLRVGAGRLRLSARVLVTPDAALLTDAPDANELDVELEVYPADE